MLAGRPASEKARESPNLKECRFSSCLGNVAVDLWRGHCIERLDSTLEKTLLAKTTLVPGRKPPRLLYWCLTVKRACLVVSRRCLEEGGIKRECDFRVVREKEERGAAGRGWEAQAPYYIIPMGPDEDGLNGTESQRHASHATRPRRRISSCAWAWTLIDRGGKRWRGGGPF